MIKVVVKTIAKPFYEAHAGFFFLLFFIAGGFMRSNEHIALATYIADSFFLTIIVLLCFLLYHFKLLLFTRSLLSAEANFFIRRLICASVQIRILTIGFVFISLSAVPLFYAFFLSFFMFDADAFLKIGWLFTYFIAIFMLYFALLTRQILRPISDIKTNFITRFISTKFSRPFVLWFPTYLIQSRPLLVLSTKVLSIILLTFCFSSYDVSEYDWRYLGMCVVIAMSANLVLSHTFFEFSVKSLNFLRGMPISAFERIAFYVAVVSILMIPEIIVLFKKMPIDAPVSLSWQATIFAIVNVLFYLNLAIYKNGTIEYMGKACLFITLLQVYLVLFGLPLYAIALLMLPIVVVA